MKKIFFYSLEFLMIFWLLAIFLLYFFNFKIIGGQCDLSDACFNIFSLHIQRGLNVAHTHYFDGIGQFFSATYPYIIIVFGFLAYIFRKKITKISPFEILVIFLLIFFVIYKYWIWKDGLGGILDYHFIYRKFFTYFFGSIAIFLPMLSIGEKLRRKIFANQKTSFFEQIIISLGIGIGVIFVLLFLLGVFHILELKLVLAILVLMAIFSYQQLYYWVRQFFSRRKLPFNLFSVQSLLLLVIIILAANNLLELVRPLPLGNDDLTRYQRLALVLSQLKYLPAGFTAYFWELIDSLGYIFFKNAMPAMFLTFFTSILSTVCVFAVTKRYLTLRNNIKLVGLKADNREEIKLSLLASAIFYSIPAVIVLITKDIKIDVPAFYFSSLSLLLYLIWRETRLNKFLLLSAIFLGISFAMKYTVIFFAAAILIIIIWDLIRFKINFFKATSLLAMFVLIFGLPFSFFGVRNILSCKGSISSSCAYLGSSESSLFNKFSPPLSEGEREFCTNIANSTGSNEDYGRVTGYQNPNFKKFLLLPFTITFQNYDKGIFSDISYLFLAIIPLLLVLYPLYRKKSQSNLLFVQIVIASIIYWTLWALFAKGVIWYGLSGFIFLILLLIETYRIVQASKFKFLNLFVWIIIFSWLFTFAAARSGGSADYRIDKQLVASYAHGDMNGEEYKSFILGDYANYLKDVNASIAKDPEHSHVYMAGVQFVTYFITRSDREVLDDVFLGTFQCLDSEMDSQKTLLRMKNEGFKYIIYNGAALRNFDNTPGKTLIKKTDLFKKFINDNKNSLIFYKTDPFSGLSLLEIR